MGSHSQHHAGVPARKQVPRQVFQEEKHDPREYNIWHDRPLVRRARPAGGRQAAAHRCNAARDSGTTKGDERGTLFCCLHFARGQCHLGADCSYLHRVPTPADDARLTCDTTHDVFGREKVDEARDTRRGPGSYERDARTLYVSPVSGVTAQLSGIQVRQLLEDNFGEWGPLQRVHLVPDKAIAFVQFQRRANAEFAKEAMHRQTLRGAELSEVLDLRWANDDPNPRAKRRVTADREQAYAHAVRAAVDQLAPDAKRARLLALQVQAAAHPGRATAAYPDTDDQYNEATLDASQVQWQYQQHTSIPQLQYDARLGYYYPQDVQQSAATGDAAAGGGEEQAGHSYPDAAAQQPDSGGQGQDALGLIADYSSDCEPD